MSTAFENGRRTFGKLGYLLILGVILGLNAVFLNFLEGHWIYFLPSLSGLIAMLICSLSEHWFRFRLDWERSFRSALGDLFQTAIVLPIIVGICCVIWAMISQHFSLNLVLARFWWSSDAPWIVHFLSALMISEFLFYWVHRWSHTSPLLWKFHRHHHSALKLDWYNAGQFHPFDLFLNFIFYMAPYFIFPVPETVLIVVLSLNVVTGLLEHANIDLRSGALNRIFNTAELHRWHHSVIPEESMRNYGKVLSIWDSVFKTYLSRDLSGLKRIGEDVDFRS